jgi:hypothetical protein
LTIKKFGDTMIVKNLTEITIFESPDGGKTVYSRTNGSPQRKLHSVSSDLETEMDRVQREQQWLNILKLSETTPALREAIDKVLVMYELSRNRDDEPPMWHPV